MKKRPANKDMSCLYIFLFVLAVAIAGLGFLHFQSPVSGAVVLVPSQPGDSVIIAGINLEEGIGADVPVLTSIHLKTLEGRKIRTQKGASDYVQVIRLLSGDFSGGKVVYSRDQFGSTGDFLYFEESEPLFELEWTFSPSLRGSLDSSGKIKGLEDEILNILGKEYMFVDSRVDGSSVLLKLVGSAGTLLLEDSDITDNSFISGIEINGRHASADLMIKGTASSSDVFITSITYRPKAEPKSVTGDIYIPPNKGVQSYLADPKVLLSRSFDIVYGGFIGAPAAGASAVSGSTVAEFMPSGNDEYRLIFTNTRGRTYAVPFVENAGGTLSFGKGGHDLVITEGSSNSDYNIDENDYFVVTSKEDVNGVTNVLKHNGVDYSGGRLFVQDLAGGSTTVIFDKASNKGSISIGGYSYDVYVSPASPHPIAVDQNADGSIDSGEAKIVVLGGGYFDVGSAGNTLLIDYVIPGRLFQEGGAGETNSIKITSPGDEVDITVTSPALEKDASGYKKAMSDFGILFVHDDDEPADLKIQFPAGGRKSAAAAKASGQVAGVVLVTTNREKFLKK